MISMGIDLGAETLKLAIMEDKKGDHSDLLITEEEGEEGSRQIVESTSGFNRKEGRSWKVIATGIGRKADLAMKLEQAICHAKGARWSFPFARTVLDVGAQGSRAMKLDESGRVIDFAETSKCASGSGFFLELMAKILNIPLDEMGKIGLLCNRKGRHHQLLFGVCGVRGHLQDSWESLLIHSGGTPPFIGPSIFDLLMKVGVTEDLVMTQEGLKTERLRDLEILAGKRSMFLQILKGWGPSEQPFLDRHDCGWH
jgi:hypothetical protein